MTPDELRALADEATPGPWREGINYFNVPLLCIQAGPDDESKMVAEMGSLEGLPVEANARLIALAPDLARLCAEMAEALEDYRSGSADHYLAKLSELKL